jgi:hypothetical protein
MLANTLSNALSKCITICSDNFSLSDVFCFDEYYITL